MNPLPNLQPEPANLPEAVALSLLNDFLFCPRRAALKAVEGWRGANEHTARGDIVHEHADLPGYEAAKGVTLLRALPVWSERLGLNGKCDVVEVCPHSASGHPLPSDGRGTGLSGKCDIVEARSREESGVQSPRSKVQSPRSEVGLEPPYPPALSFGAASAGSYSGLVPVEYKKGKRRQFENDDAQLCAQGLCLEEMFGMAVERGAVFHAASKRRREVEFTAGLRKVTEEAIAGLHRLVEGFQISDSRSQTPALPAAVFKPACEECSLFEICLPRVTSGPARAARAAIQLFEA